MVRIFYCRLQINREWHSLVITSLHVTQNSPSQFFQRWLSRNQRLNMVTNDFEQRMNSGLRLDLVNKIGDGNNAEIIYVLVKRIVISVDRCLCF